VTKWEFKQEIDKLSRRFHRREMSTEEMDDWYEQLREIDSGAWPALCATRWAKNRTFPTPAELLGDWYEWAGSREREQPRDQNPTWCPECHGRGFLEVRMVGDELLRQLLEIEDLARQLYAAKTLRVDPDPQSGRGYTYAVLCARCQNWQRHVPHPYVKRSGGGTQKLRVATVAEEEGRGGYVLTPSPLERHEYQKRGYGERDGEVPVPREFTQGAN